MSNPLITVIIPAYNASSHIEKCLQSVSAQGFGEKISMLVIDDGSTDNTEETVRNYIEATNSKNITLLKKSNGGASSARNFGLKIACSPFIAFLDADDEWLPEKIRKQMKAFEENESIYFLGTNRNSENYFFRRYFNDDIYEMKIHHMLLKWWPSVPTVVFKRSVLEKVGYFDEDIMYCEDTSYWLRVLCHFPIHVLNESLVVTGGGKENFGEAGLSSNIAAMHKGEIRAVGEAYKRKQIALFEKIFFTFYLKIKFQRRRIIVWLRSVI